MIRATRAPEAVASVPRSDLSDGTLSRRRVMLGLLMMSVPLGFAVGLSAVALVRAEPDGSAGENEEDTSGQRRRDRR